MVTACLIATTNAWAGREGQAAPPVKDTQEEFYDSLDGPSEEEAYMQGGAFPRCGGDWSNRFSGEYKLILQLVGVLSHGKVAKKLADRAIDLMEDVQNLRKAIYPYVEWIHRIDFYLIVGDCGSRYKLKVETSESGSAKQRKLMSMGVNYLCVWPPFPLIRN